MDINELPEKFRAMQKELEDFAAGEDKKRIAGQEAVNFFKESFQNEGFTDQNLQKWPNVKRRDPNSPWYGHSGQTRKFSEARTTAKILNGETSQLKDATTYTKTATGVRVYNEMPYAKVHNFGGTAKIYGKKAFRMLARPFIGPSAQLKQRIMERVAEEIEKIKKRY